MDKFYFKLNGKRRNVNFIACDNPMQDLLCLGNDVIMSGRSISRFRDWLNKQDIHKG